MNFLIVLLAFACHFVVGAAEKEVQKPFVIADLAWMAGQWRDIFGETEEHWMAPKNETMVGMSRTVSKNGKVEFEFIRIAVTTNGIAYIAQPGGRPPTLFILKEHSERRVVFENLNHDFPQTVRYWPDDDGKLHAQIEGTVAGTRRQREWVWERVK